jgi:hypothetical protein
MVFVKIIKRYGEVEKFEAEVNNFLEKLNKEKNKILSIHHAITNDMDTRKTEYFVAIYYMRPKK